jgi:hypothetical protein
MKKLGFTRCYSDSGVFVHRAENGDIVIAVIYVDDSAFMGNNLQLTSAKKAQFMKQWDSRDLGELKEFLGIRVTRSGRTIKLDQREYLQKVLTRFNMLNANPAATLLPTGYLPKPGEDAVDLKLQNKFQQIIGSLM